MKISDVIADMILDMFDDNKSTVQIQRNDLAARVGCGPSQSNYVCLVLIAMFTTHNK